MLGGGFGEVAVVGAAFVIGVVVVGGDLLSGWVGMSAEQLSVVL